MRAPASRWPLVLALLMGAAVGPYSSFASVTQLDVAFSIVALALPVLLSVALDTAIPGRSVALAKTGVCVLVLGGLLLANSMNPAIWRGYAGTAASASVFAAMLLSPLCAGFVSGAGTDPAAPFAYAARKSLAWRCGALAWLGIGIHDFFFPYLLPFIGLAINGSSGGGYVPVVALGALLVLLSAAYVTGFGLAIATGLGGEALHARLRRVPVAVA
jgi:hypothetical protein